MKPSCASRVSARARGESWPAARIARNRNGNRAARALSTPGAGPGLAGRVIRSRGGTDPARDRRLQACLVRLPGAFQALMRRSGRALRRSAGILALAGVLLLGA